MNLRLRNSASFETAAILGALLAGCGSDSTGSSATTGGAAGSEAGGTGSGVGGSASGTGGATGTSGTGGSESEAEVPRPANTDGESVLNNPSGSVSQGGLCEEPAVYCNGTCLARAGESEGNCKALILGLGQTESIAMSTDALFFTAANTEILKTDLQAETHVSLVRGLTFPTGLHTDGDLVYFSSDEGDHFDPFNNVVLSVSSEHQRRP